MIDQNARAAVPPPSGRQTTIGGKKIFIVLVLLIIAGLGWYFRFTIEKKFATIDQLAQTPFIQNIKQNISAPPPLIGDLLGQNSPLTDAG